MKKNYNTKDCCTIVIIIIICNKNLISDPNNQVKEPVKALNQKEKETVDKFEHECLVLQGVFQQTPQFARNSKALLPRNILN